MRENTAQNKILVQRAFHDVLTKTGQITGASPCGGSNVTGPTGVSSPGINFAAGDNGMDPICLASAFLARGKSVPFSDFLTCVSNAQRSSLKFPSWNPDACKVSCYT